jgi:hypothetical protein
MKTKMLYAFLLMAVVGFTSCKKEKVDPNEVELITTVRVKLTEKVLGGTGALTVFEFKDLDGEGGAAPSKFDEITLQKGKIYDCVLEILNESVSPAENITAEIIKEANDHQFYFLSTNGLVVFSNFNADVKGFPLGTSSIWTASSSAGTGTLNITLKHKPGAKTANDNINVGETDISLDFKVKVL